MSFEPKMEWWNEAAAAAKAGRMRTGAKPFWWAWRCWNGLRPRGLFGRLWQLALAVFFIGIELNAGFLEEPSQRLIGIVDLVACLLIGVSALGPRRVVVDAARSRVIRSALPSSRPRTPRRRLSILLGRVILIVAAAAAYGALRALIH